MPRLPRTVAAIAVSLAVGACTQPSTEEATTAEPSASAIRMAVVGDSITDADSPDLAGGVPGPTSWVSYAVGSEIEFIGGWAAWGATTANMADAVQTPFEADVLVILAGTNDSGWVPCEDTSAHLAQVVSSAAVDDVVLSSVPPIDSAAEAAHEMNACLQALAEHQGWTWVDAAAGLREDGLFVEGMSTDGVHPSEAGARVLGEAIADAVLDAASG